MKYTIDELTAAKRQIDSTLHKLRETVKTFESKDNSERYKSQITLAKRRIKAFEIANYFYLCGWKLCSNGRGCSERCGIEPGVKIIV